MKAAQLKLIDQAKSVPFIDLKRTFRHRSEAIIADWREVLASGEFVGGKGVATFEQKLKEKLQAKEVMACANGTDAILLALRACGIKAGSKVAVPNLTFWATYEAVIHAGAIPVLIDINAEDLQMDFEEIKLAHNKFKLDAVVIAHLYGWATAQLIELREYCERENIILIEDGAQAFGVKFQNRSIFADAKIATLSFYPAKVLGGAMDGGAVLSNDAALIEKCRCLANHGRSQHYSYSQVGWNSRMGGLQAAYLLEMLVQSDQLLDSRRNSLESYRRKLIGTFSAELKLWQPPKGFTSNGYLATTTLAKLNAEKFCKSLKELGVGTSRVYPETIAEQPCVPKEILKVSELKNSFNFSRKVVNLPLFAFMNDEEVNFVSDMTIALLNEEKIP